MRARAGNPRVRAASARRDHDRGAAVGDARRRARRDDSRLTLDLAKDRRQPAQAVDRRFARVLVAIDGRAALEAAVPPTLTGAISREK